MNPSSATETPVTYVGKEGEVRLCSDHRSGRLRIAVAGREVEVSVTEAQRVIEKMRRAVIWAQS